MLGRTRAGDVSECDRPSCCASSRCSPPQRRALPRRVAPFFPPLCLFIYLYLFVTPARLPSCPPFRLLLLLRCRNSSPPPRDVPAAPLAAPLLTESLSKASWSCSQKTLHANNRRCDVVRRGRSRGRGWLSCCFQGCQRKRNHDFQREFQLLHLDV